MKNIRWLVISVLIIIIVTILGLIFLPQAVLLCSANSFLIYSTIISTVTTILVAWIGLVLGLFYYFNRIKIERKKLGIDKLDSWIRQSDTIMQKLLYYQIKEGSIDSYVRSLHMIGTLFIDNAEDLLKLLGLSIKNPSYSEFYNYFSYVTSETPSFIRTISDVESMRVPAERNKYYLLISNASSSLIRLW